MAPSGNTLSLPLVSRIYHPLPRLHSIQSSRCSVNGLKQNACTALSNSGSRLVFDEVRFVELRVHKRTRGEKEREGEEEEKKQKRGGTGIFHKATSNRHKDSWSFLCPVLCIYYVMHYKRKHKRRFVTTCYYTARTCPQIGYYSKGTVDKLESPSSS